MDSVPQLWNTFAAAVINEKADQKERKNTKKLLRRQRNSSNENTLEMLNIKRREQNGNFNL